MRMAIVYYTSTQVDGKYTSKGRHLPPLLHVFLLIPSITTLITVVKLANCLDKIHNPSVATCATSATSTVPASSATSATSATSVTSATSSLPRLPRLLRSSKAFLCTHRTALLRFSKSPLAKRGLCKQFPEIFLSNLDTSHTSKLLAAVLFLVSSYTKYSHLNKRSRQVRNEALQIRSN